MDASAVVAILGIEDDWQSLADRLDQDETRLWSPVSYWESVMALAKRLEKSVEDTQGIVADFGVLSGFQLVSIGLRESQLAIDASQRFGRNSGHPARLNMGDCFAYACARANGARLLYKGNDFARTDLA